MSVAGIVIMSNSEDDMPNISFDENCIINLSGMEKMDFIE